MDDFIKKYKELFFSFTCPSVLRIINIYHWLTPKYLKLAQSLENKLFQLTEKSLKNWKANSSKFLLVKGLFKYDLTLFGGLSDPPPPSL